MAAGLFIAVIVTLAWVVLQIGLMHVRPAENRIRSMTLGYVISLPFVFVAYRWLPLPASIASASAGESWAMGLILAYLLHLLLYFCYVECFYHVERAVTLRFLTEIM